MKQDEAIDVLTEGIAEGERISYGPEEDRYVEAMKAGRDALKRECAKDERIAELERALGELLAALPKCSNCNTEVATCSVWPTARCHRKEFCAVCRVMREPHLTAETEAGNAIRNAQRVLEER